MSAKRMQYAQIGRLKSVSPASLAQRIFATDLSPEPSLYIYVLLIADPIEQGHVLSASNHGRVKVFIWCDKDVFRSYLARRERETSTSFKAH